MTADPQPTPFAVEMKRRREEIGMKIAQLATRSGLSDATVGQIERGYYYSGGLKIQKPVSRDAVLRIAKALEWPTREAMELAGHDYTPGEVVEEPEDLAVERAMEVFRQMSYPQQDVFYNTMRVAIDPYAQYKPLRQRATSNRPVFTAPDSDTERSRR